MYQKTGRSASVIWCRQPLPLGTHQRNNWHRYRDTQLWRKPRTKKTIGRWHKTIVSKCYFLWNDNIYLLKNSAPVAEAYLQYHEKNAIEEASRQTPPVAPKSLLRYVDDSPTRFVTNNQAIAFQEILNKQDKKNKKKSIPSNQRMKSHYSFST